MLFFKLFVRAFRMFLRSHGLGGLALSHTPTHFKSVAMVLAAFSFRCTTGFRLLPASAHFRRKKFRSSIFAFSFLLTSQRTAGMALSATA